MGTEYTYNTGKTADSNKKLFVSAAGKTGQNAFADGMIALNASGNML